MVIFQFATLSYQRVVQFTEEFGVPRCYLANGDGSSGDDFADAKGQGTKAS